MSAANQNGQKSRERREMQMPDKSERQYISVEGIVSRRDGEPSNNFLHGMTAQMSMSEARNFARDIEKLCARTEADAMIHRFFAEMEYPEGAEVAVMLAFREFRSRLDAEEVGKRESPPSGDQSGDADAR